MPVALGAKVTDAEQLVPAAKVFGLRGHVVVNPKSDALIVMAVIFSAVLWLLVKVIPCGGLVVPKACPAKVRLPEFTVAGSMPAPLSPTVLLPLLVLIVSVLLRVPVAAGVKKTETEHVAPPDMVLGASGQLVVVVKSVRSVAILLTVILAVEVFLTVTF